MTLKRNVTALVLAASCLAGPGRAQDLDYAFAETWTCVGRAEDPAARHACIGRAAEACMEATPGGASTAGMLSCLDAELSDWDAALNAAYKPLLARLEDLDAEAPEYVTLSQADALRAMQRVWIGYRDATCDYERAKWQGGTGGGPAAVACLMELTARQALKLQSDVNFE